MGVTVMKRVPELSKKLSESTKKNLPATMRKISKHMQSKVQKRIESNTPPPNSPLTVANKQGNKTLQDTGEFMASISAHSGENWAAAGSNLQKAKTLQEGAEVTAKKTEYLWIPAGAHVRTLMNRFNATKAGELIPALRAAG